jgi:radical SAM superfamily enzyme YgiQ (UPF0313 family)
MAGFSIVLTADRTLTADYALLFDGMLAASQTTTAPPALFSRLLMPHRGSRQLRARIAPLGLRRIEAALLADGLSPRQVAVVDEDHLAQAIGPATRVIGISSGEPAGLGMNSSTMTAVAGGRIYPAAMFRRLLRKIHALNRRPQATIVLGGPGAWQLAGDPARRRALRIDHVLTGYAEGGVAATFRTLLRRELQPATIAGYWRPGVPVPPLQGATTFGAIEISRGCGWGCPFCTLAREPMFHLPPETILSDARTNVAAGMRNLVLLSEDFFRYGADGATPRPEILLDLVRRIRAIPGVGLLQVDHANAASIAHYDDRQLAELHDGLVGPRAMQSLWINVGVETASEELLVASGAGGKMPRDRAQPWGDFCAEQLRRLCRAGFFPMASLMIALPGERDEHLRETLDWVQSLSCERMAIFPVLYAPLDGSPPPDRRALRPAHWELLKTCYRMNFRQVPRMYAENQAAVGVSPLRRSALQLLGRGQILQWKLLLAWHARRSRQ